MWLNRTVSFLAKVFERATRWINSAAVVILAAMMFLTAADVILRYVFNRPVPGAFELQRFMMVILVAAAISYTAYIKGHINVDIVFGHLPKRFQESLNVFHYFLGSCVFAVVCWRTILEGLALQARGFTSSTLLIPVFPFYFIIAFCSALLCLTWLYSAVESLLKGVGKWTQQP